MPALVYLLGQSAHGATTASLVIVGVTSLAGTVAHWRAGRVQVAKGTVFGVLGIAGSFVGARLSAGVSSDVLLSAFAGLVVVAAVAMALRVFGPKRPAVGRAVSPGQGDQGKPDVLSSQVGAGGRAQSSGEPQVHAWSLFSRSRHVGSAGSGTAAVAVATATLAVAGKRSGGRGALRSGGWPSRAVPGRVVPNRLADVARVVLAATVVGLLTGFFGVGGGFIVVPALVLSLRFEMPVAVGTSLLVIVVNTAAALLARLGTHADVDWAVVAVFVLAAVAGSPAGNLVASRVQPKRLAVAFTLLLLAVALYTGARSFPHLA